jgi:PAS domain-containing protein
MGNNDKMLSIVKLFEQNNQIQVYCDLDGVLSDFNTAAEKGLGYDKSKPVGDLWSRIAKDPHNFWKTMPWMPDGKKLWAFIKPYNPIILSSVGNSLTNKIGVEGKKGKLEWITRELGPQFAKTAIITVNGGKSQYSSPDSVLIDDNKKNIDPWVEAGGIGIVHKSADDTIEKLKKVLK